jgi:acetyl-CoA C-acetyltransferase
VPIDPRTPCLIGVGKHTWHPGEVGEEGAPEPLAMWEQVARSAAAESGAGAALLEALDAIDIVYCQTWQYDDPPARLSDRLGASPERRHYSGIGGTTPQVLVQDAATRILAGDSDLAMIVGAEALATQRAFKKRGERPTYSFKPDERRPFPWEAPFNDSELAHELQQAWLTFAVFDNARRAHLGIGLPEYRRRLGTMMVPMTTVAAANPDAWFRIERTADEVIGAGSDNRMVGYPYTKYMVSIMDVDMAAAVVIASHERADALGVPKDQRVYLRGWCYATDPIYVAEHDEMWRSPAMQAASTEALRIAGVGVDDLAHLDLYSCFASSVNFARDALGISDGDPRPLTVTGGLPYHGGAGSDYMTHSIATMAERLRADPGSYGMVSGVGMHMTKHVYGVYSTEPGPVEPPDQGDVQDRLDGAPRRTIVERHDGDATVAAYSVVHGRDGDPEWGVLVCDVADGGRAYARLSDDDALREAETTELVGARVRLVPTDIDLPTGGTGVRHDATVIST